MKARLSVNMNLDTQEECYGVVIQMEPKRRFCKYLYKQQSYKTRNEANTNVAEANSKLRSGFVPRCNKSVNIAEYVTLEKMSSRSNFLVNQNSHIADRTNKELERETEE